MKRLFLDFEFNKSSEPNNNPICVSYTAIWEDQQEWGNYWLLNPEEREEFLEVIEEYIEDDFTFVAFYAAAEARSLISLGVKVTNIKWVCLWVEYHMLLNHNNRFSTGKHLVEGKEKILYPPKPKWERTDDDPSSQKAETSLVACTYKLCGVNISQENKDAMRDLILENDSWTEEEQAKIMHYCQSDITYLPKILEKIYVFYRKAYSKSDQKNLNQEILLRGKYAAITAEMESSGYPINVAYTKNFSNSVKSIIFEMQKEINDKFAWGPFLIDKKGEKFTQKEKPIRDWIARQKHATWLETEKGAASLSLEAFEKHYTGRGDLNVFGNAFVKYLRNKQSLNGFMPKKKGKTLYDSLGSDGRVRPYFGIFRAQSSRSQPSATGYILLKSSWMRCLIEPPRGRTIIAVDYSQQEFLIAGLLSRCEAMLKAYESGDVYLYTGKLAGAIPWKGTKKEYPELRDQFKSTTLGIQYGMAAPGLAVKLTNDTGKYHSEEDAQELINQFESAYPEFIQWRTEVWDQYLSDGYLKLPCGWTMWGDNQNRRSVQNMPVQGLGASIMRKSVEFAFEQGLEVIMTLHDAIYVECDTRKTLKSLELLSNAMDEGFKHYIPDDLKARATCRQDPTVWGPDWKEGQQVVFQNKPIKAYQTYIDERTRSDYEKYRKYFEKYDDLDLL